MDYALYLSIALLRIFMTISFTVPNMDANI